MAQKRKRVGEREERERKGEREEKGGLGCWLALKNKKKIEREGGGGASKLALEGRWYTVGGGSLLGHLYCGGEPHLWILSYEGEGREGRRRASGEREEEEEERARGLIKSWI